MTENTLDPSRYRTTQVPIPVYQGYPRILHEYQQEEAIELLGGTSLKEALGESYIQSGDKLIVYATTEGENGALGPTVRVTIRRDGIDNPRAYVTDGNVFETLDADRLIAQWRLGELLTVPLPEGKAWASDRRISHILVRTGRRDNDARIQPEQLVRPSGVEALPIAFDAMYGAAYRRRYLNQGL